MHPRSSPQSDTSTSRAPDQPWSVLILLAIAQFMVVLDITVVNVALPSIGTALEFSPADLQWVVTAYVLFTGGLLLLGGRAADLFGRRRMFLVGLTIFTGASLASGLASSPGMLIAGRAAQGLGAALLTPSALSIITTTYVGSQRTAALAAWGAIGSAGAAAGVVLGGLLTTWLGWEWAFFINVPVGVATGLLALRLVASEPVAAGGLRQLDLPGALSGVAGLVLLVFAIEGAAEHGWGSARTLTLLAIAAGLLRAFVAIERRVPRPLLPPAMWKVRSLTSGVGLMLGATGLLIGAFFLNTIYLQHDLGASALETGLAFLPLTLVIGLGAHVASRLLPSVGTRALAVAGLGLVAGGALLLAAAPDNASYAANILPGFTIMGLGIGLVFPVASIATMSDVPAERAGLASGLLTTGHEIGAAIGVAAFSAIATATGGGYATFAAGYEDGFLVAAVAAVALAVTAFAALPSVRPTGVVPMAAH